MIKVNKECVNSRLEEISEGENKKAAKHYQQNIQENNLASSALRSSRRDLYKGRHNYKAQSNWMIRDGEKDFSKEEEFVLGHMLSELYVFLEAIF